MDNTLTPRDILNIKEALIRAAIACDKNANEMQYPAIVRQAMTVSAISYRQTLEKINTDIPTPRTQVVRLQR